MVTWESEVVVLYRMGLVMGDGLVQARRCEER